MVSTTPPTTRQITASRVRESRRPGQGERVRPATSSPTTGAPVPTNQKITIRSPTPTPRGRCGQRLARERPGRDRSEGELGEQVGDPTTDDAGDPDRQAGAERALGLEDQRQHGEQHGRRQPHPALQQGERTGTPEGGTTLGGVGFPVLPWPSAAPAGSSPSRPWRPRARRSRRRPAPRSPARPATLRAGRLDRHHEDGDDHDRERADHVRGDQQRGEQQLHPDPQRARRLVRGAQERDPNGWRRPPIRRLAVIPDTLVRPVNAGPAIRSICRRTRGRRRILIQSLARPGRNTHMGPEE